MGDAHLSDCAHGLWLFLVDLAAGKGPRRAFVPSLDEQDLHACRRFPSVFAPRGIYTVSKDKTSTHLVPPFVDQDGAADGYSLFVLHERGPYPRVLGYEVVQERAGFEHEERESLEVVGREGGRVRGIWADEIFVVPVSASGYVEVRVSQCLWLRFLLRLLLAAGGWRGLAATRSVLRQPLSPRRDRCRITAKMAAQCSDVVPVSARRCRSRVRCHHPT